MTDLSIRRGDTRLFKLWLTDPSGARLPLADKKLWFTAKRSVTDPDASAIIRKGTANTGLTGITVADAPGAPTATEPWLGGDVATVTIATADTAGLPDHDTGLAWDAQFAPSAGGDPQTPDAWTGTLTVIADVTRSS